MPHIPSDAPFNDQQRSWLDGFIAGLNSQQFANKNKKLAEQTQNQITMNILFGTQTGNAEELANDAAALATTRGFESKLHELDSIDLNVLAEMEQALIIVSTYGEGEMPDNANFFWDSLSAATAPRLDKLNYAVLALGDTSYDEFCQAGKLIDIRLEQLGAIRSAQRIDCDVDYEDSAARWLDEAIPVLETLVTNNTSSQSVEKPKTLVEKTRPKWNKKNPYLAGVLENRLLSGLGSRKEIRHISFDLSESLINYEPGDSIGVIPTNAADLVEKILVRIGANFDDVVSGFDHSLGFLLTNKFEISTPSRDFVHKLESRANSPELSEVFLDKLKLEKFLWGRDILDLLNLDTDLKLCAEEILSWLKPLQHRAYSISSSQKAWEKEVHLTVAAVRWSLNDREHKGVASTYLADCVHADQKTGIFLSSNKNFRPPNDDSVPMIMVGPGTGIAPFRAFLQERQVTGASGMNWLFFGDQHKKCDFLYKDELETMKESGVLDRLDLAFSRDQSEKIYVQKLMIEEGKALFSSLEDGGYFYVCGDASRMAKDVEKTLHYIVSKHGEFSSEKTEEYIKNLKREKRYLRDVY
ncbi:MAG: sulfite reductase subunit alpha [Rhodospirillaceae bacterium]|nr:sulfite reductase subunit alpha [Rhodospirillaceae bacterium]